MTVYIVIYLLIFISSVFLYAKDFDKKKAVRIISAVSFVLLTAMFALRHPSMGVDLGYGGDYGYLWSFSDIAGFSWKEAFVLQVQNYERGYILFNKLISVFSDNQQVFLGVVAFAGLLPIFYTIQKKMTHPDLAIYIFMGLPCFLMFFSGVRQAIAIGICFYAIQYIMDRKLIKFLITVLIATLFHTSAWVFLLAYPIYYIPMTKARRMLSYAIIPIIYVFRYPLFVIFSVLFKENAVPDNNSAFTLFFVFTLVYVFCGLFSDESEQTAGLKNIFFVACCIQALGGVYSTVMRVGYYFMVALVLLLPLLVVKQTNKRNARIIKRVVTVCFVLFGLYSLYNGSWAQSNPYRWFWR